MILKDIELKYKINAYRITKEYPTQKDILFDMIKYIMSTNKRKKNWKTEEFEIDFNNIENAIPLFSNEDKKKLIKKIIYDLFDEKYILSGSKNIKFTQKAIDLFYK